MDVYIHKDAHFASIATSLYQYHYTDNPMGELRPNQLAGIFKKENIRSYNYAHGRRLKIGLCATINAVPLTAGEIIQATARMENQMRAREDYPKSEAAKIIRGIYEFLPPFFENYDAVSVSGVTLAGILKSFATYDDGTGMKSWHWDEDWGKFEESENVAPGRVKPYPWLMRQILGDEGIKFKYVDAEAPEPLAAVKFLRECLILPKSKTAEQIHWALLHHHILRVPEVASAPSVDIGMDDEALR